VRVNRRGIWFGMTKHGLADRDVLRCLVRPRAQTVTKTVPANISGRRSLITAPKILSDSSGSLRNCV
jgi:hypothetical protein